MYKCLALFLIASSLAAADVITLADVTPWCDTFDTVEGWEAQPDWLNNPDLAASVTVEDGVACFRVNAPGLGMKWSRDVPPLTVEEAPYLVLRYRAEGIRGQGTDYLVYINAHGPGEECRPITFSDAVADGEWRAVAVDVRRTATGPAIDTVALHVQAGPEGNAALWVDALSFVESPPHDALLLGFSEEMKADTSIDLAKLEWTPQPSWLNNPAGQCGAAEQDAGMAFAVDEPGQGMKWSAGFPEPLDITGYRFLAVRYRAENLRPYHDYAVCFLGQPGDGAGHVEVVHGVDLESAKGCRTAVVPLREEAAQIPKPGGIAVQVQAGQGAGRLVIEHVALVNERPVNRLPDILPHSPGAAFDGFAPVDLTGMVNQSLGPVLDASNLDAWPGALEWTALGIPFRMTPGETCLAATGLAAKGELTIPVNGRTPEVYLLLMGVMNGKDEEVFGGGPFLRVDDVDRFRLRLAYEDGTAEECLPGNVASGRFEVVKGPHVVCASADSTKRLRSVTVCDGTPDAGFAVAGVTCRAEGGPLFPEFREDFAAIATKSWPEPPEPGALSAEANTEGCVLGSNLMRAAIEVQREGGGVPMFSLHDAVAGQDLMAEAAPLISLNVEGRQEPSQLRSREERVVPDGRVAMKFDIVGCPGLELDIEVAVTKAGGLRFGGKLVNTGREAYAIGLDFPKIGPYVLGDDLAANEYVYPCRAAYIGRAPVSLSTRYSGMFGLQFMATAHPEAGQGLYLRTEDAGCIERSYVLRKDEAGMFLGMSYPQRRLAPGEARPLAETILQVTDGDWHGALEDYREWLATWFKPVSPRQPWFREVFNFRQRFLHWLDPLYDRNQGNIDLQRAVDEARAQFGGIDYLHLFDWGNCGPHGRIYGRVGDYSPYDYLEGGRENLYTAIAGIREQGIPVGLYIEGYLLNEKGKLGQAHGAEWQLMHPGDQGARWPGSVEIYVCPAVEAWRNVQAQTYAAKVEELGVAGMYIDQFGFTGHSKDCCSASHGHPVPSYPVLTEMGMLQAIRGAVDAVKPGVALYTEETPCDVASQWQDGAFTYEMNHLHGRRAEIPINLFRFGVPDLKTFEILICDKPTGSWATGVRWTFFNGEGIWLEGPADEWFSPETCAAIRKCHAILKQHADAFLSEAPVPLVSTLAGGIYANRFPSADKEVWTLYNGRHRTFRGPVLRVPHRDGWHWHDAWHDAAPEVEVDETTGYDTVRTHFGPHGVGCLVRLK